MRRLVGLIVLLVLILGAAWLARNDFDLNRIAEFDTLFESADEGEATKVPPAEVASAPDASQSETEAEVPSDATAGAEVGPIGPETTEPTEPATMAAEPAAPDAETMAAAEPDAPEADTTMAPETPSADTEVDTAMAEPADAAGPEPAPPVVVVPSFDIVRVEPTGETVLAGVAEPQAMVEVLNGPDPVATAEANERGEWALVLEEPLPPGTHDLGIRTTSQDRSLVTLSDQRVAVSVPESAGEEPLVVINEPDAPSRVIQLPADAETPAAPEVAVVPEPQQSEAMQEPPASSAETEIAAAPQPEPTAEMTSSGESEMAPPPADAASSDAPMETQGAETGVAAAPQPEPMMETPSSGESEMASASSEAESPAAPMETATETEVASAPEPEPVAESSTPSGAPEGAAVPPTMAPTTETVPEAPAQSGESSPIAEAEVAAAPEPGSAPLDQAEMTASPTAPPADVGGETMTAAASDTAAPETTAAAARERPKPPAAGGEMSNEAPSSSEPSSPTEIAAAPPASEAGPAAAETAAAEPVGSPAPPEPQAEPPASVEAAPPATPEVGVAAVEAETNGTLYIAGTATTPEPVRVYVDDEFLGEATPTESGTWLLETTREMAPDEYTIRADQVDAGSGNVLARAEVPFEREIDVATLKPIGESASAGTAELSGGIAGPMQVIIKRGDNLWRISREMYGHGVRYSTIYQANRDQIRNPNLIYPGQVFVLPAGDTAWEPQQ